MPDVPPIAPAAPPLASAPPPTRRPWLWPVIVLLVAIISGGSGFWVGRSLMRPMAPTTVVPAVITLPPAATIASTCVVGLGKQYILPADVPNGPIYNVVDGKVIGLEMMFNAAEIKADPSRFRHIDLGGHNFRYLNVESVIEGHAGNGEPHYHLDLFTEPMSVAEAIKCTSSDGGVHDSINTSGHATH